MSGPALSVADMAALATAVFTLALAVIAFFQLSALVKQLKLSEANEMERRTVEICSRFILDPTIVDMKRRIFLARTQAEADGNNRAIVAEGREIKNLLNFLDIIAIGVNQGIYDADIVYDNLGIVIVDATEKFIDAHPLFNPAGTLVTAEHFPALVNLAHTCKARRKGTPPQPAYRRDGQ